MDINELIENFELLEDWEDKYRYLIELGEEKAPLSEEYKTDEWKIRGCQSQVWLVPEKKDGVLTFKGDSDAAIVRGIIAIVQYIYSGKSATEIKSVAVSDIFARMGLNEHLSPSRRNGLMSMVEKIRYYADIM